MSIWIKHIIDGRSTSNRDSTHPIKIVINNDNIRWRVKSKYRSTHEQWARLSAKRVNDEQVRHLRDNLKKELEEVQNIIGKHGKIDPFRTV